MKRFILIFLICYIPISVFFLLFFGNMNFFGVQDFHMNFSDLLAILFYWSMPVSLFVSGIIYAIIDSINN